MYPLPKSGVLNLLWHLGWRWLAGPTRDSLTLTNYQFTHLSLAFILFFNFPSFYLLYICLSTFRSYCLSSLPRNTNTSYPFVTALRTQIFVFLFPLFSFNTQNLRFTPSSCLLCSFQPPDPHHQTSSSAVTNVYIHPTSLTPILIRFTSVSYHLTSS